MVDIQSAAAEIRRGKKKEDRKKPQGKNIMVCPVPQGDHKKPCGVFLINQCIYTGRRRKEPQRHSNCITETQQFTDTVRSTMQKATVLTRLH